MLALTWIAPGVIRSGGGVPGSSRSDLWNSLWGLWHGVNGLGHTTWLNHPEGGSLVIADPLHAVLAWPLVQTVGVELAWSLLVVLHLALAGIATHALACRLGASFWGGLLAGVGFESAPVLLASVHNGTSEALGWGWLPLSLYAIHRMLGDGSLAHRCLATGTVTLAGLSSPYIAVAVWVSAPVLLAERGKHPRRLFGCLAVATCLVLPWYAWAASGLGGVDDLVGIKDARELALVRRTIGAADPLGYILPRPYRSPDFREISRYGETFIHTTYLGWVLLAGFGVALVRKPPLRLLALAGLGLVLSLGPVLVIGGEALLLPGQLGIPLPFIALEWLPGLGSLSLLWRFGAIVSLALALGLALSVRRGVTAVPLAVLVVLETAVLSPMAGGPDATVLPTEQTFLTIREGPEGGVMNWPVAGGRPYLYEATLHGRPLAGTLNFPASTSARSVFRSLSTRTPRYIQVARARGIRYLVVHDRADAGPGSEDAGVEWLETHQEPLAVGEGTRVYQLW